MFTAFASFVHNLLPHQVADGSFYSMTKHALALCSKSAHHITEYLHSEMCPSSGKQDSGKRSKNIHKTPQRVYATSMHNLHKPGRFWLVVNFILLHQISLMSALRVHCCWAAMSTEVIAATEKYTDLFGNAKNKIFSFLKFHLKLRYAQDL